MPYKDHEKQKKAQRESAKRRREKIRVYVAAKRKKIGDYIRDQKRSPCVDCGGTFPPYVMDFDHVRGTKVEVLSLMANRMRSIDEIDAEIAKCDLVCANCHRIRSAQRAGHSE